MSEIRIDALLPQEMASRAEYLGVRKAEMAILKTFMLAILAGAFIALGAIFATTVSAAAIPVVSPDGSLIYNTALPYGLVRLLAGLVFCLGLILVVVGGAELFTGNNLIIMAWASGKVTVQKVLRNWIIVYFGNFIGAVATAILMFFARQYTFGSNAVGVAALKTAVSKCDLTFIQAVALGILCNALVCMAVWLTYSARSTTDKILAIIFPITAFVAAGFEHSVANMYFIPYGLFVKYFDPDFVGKVSGQISHLEKLTWQNFFLNNLIPVTLGNIIGGSLLVAAVYWAIYLRKFRIIDWRGEMMKAYVLVKIRAGEVKEVVRSLRKVDGVKEAHMTFGPYDAVAEVETPDVAKLGDITASKIQPIPGVEQTLTCLAVDV